MSEATISRNVAAIERLWRESLPVQEAASRDDLNRAVDKIAGFHRSLQEALASVVERERYVWQIDQMQQRIVSAEEELHVKSLTLQQLGKRGAVTQYAADVAVNLCEVRGHEIDEAATAAYSKALRAVMEMGHITPEVFMRIFQDAFNGEGVPEATAEKVLYYLCVLLNSVVRFSVTLECAAYSVHAALYEFDRNPDQHTEEIRRKLASRMRAGTISLRDSRIDDRTEKLTTFIDLPEE